MLLFSELLKPLKQNHLFSLVNSSSVSTLAVCINLYYLTNVHLESMCQHKAVMMTGNEFSENWRPEPLEEKSDHNRVI